jgi:ElaB/YqjD/DUF883 family membrane-anchored ribosome-binding protein
LRPFFSTIEAFNKPTQFKITILMKKHNSVANEVETLVDDAQALLSATAHVAEDKVVEARRRLTNAITSGKEAWLNLQDKAAAGAKATDEVIRDHPYHSLGVAFGVGALVGFLLHRRN